MTSMTEYEMHSLAVLGRIASALETIAMSNAKAPNLQRPLDQYRDFDFTTIGATVVGRDETGVTLVDHAGFRYMRRSADNKFAKAVWFSRSDGKDPDTGENKYVRLITFKIFGEAEPLPRKVEAEVGKPARKTPEPTTEPVKPSSGVELLPAKKTGDGSYCTICLADMTEQTKEGVRYHIASEGRLCNGSSMVNPKSPDACSLHIVSMTEQTKEGVPVHRIIEAGGKTVAFCNGSVVRPTNGAHK